jgi:hypothetical protein
MKTRQGNNPMSKNKYNITNLYSFTRASIFLILFLSFISYSQNPNWIVYNTANSPLPGNNISSIVVDTNNVKWIAISPSHCLIMKSRSDEIIID